MVHTLAVYAVLLSTGCLQATAVGQVRPDDAGDTQQTAGVLHVGVNDGYSEYQLPRRPDVDVWGLQTQAGRIYRITSGPIDAPWEVFTLDPSFYQPLSTAWALVELGYTAEARWLSGGGGIEYLTILGAARATGEPRRYQVVVDSFADPGDPEPDIESEGILLSDGEWYSGTLTPDRRLPDRVVPDVDCFRFACSDGGVYRAEILLTSGAAPGVWSPSFYTQIRGVPVSSDHPAGSPCLVNLYNGMYKAVGDCTLTINLRWNERYALSHFYRVGVTRVSSAPTDDHGNTSDRATFLRPPTLGSVRVDGAIGGPGVFNYPPAASTRGDIDWFAVELAPGRACTVDVLRAGLYPYLPQDLSYSNQSGLRVVGEVAEWGALGSCEAALPATPGSSSVPVKSMRFRSRDDGRPIRFGLAGPPGTYRVVAADLGPVTDMTGDPHTNGAAVVRVEEPVAGSLEYPTDVDSLLIERPTAPGIYRLRCRYTVPNSPNSVIFPGFSLVRSVGPEQYTRTTQFHVQDASVSMTSLGGAGLDSFPARLDLLNKRYPEGSFPATGPAHSYNVSLDYVGPVTTSHLIGPSADDEAPATLAGAPTVQVGVPFQARRHLGGDLADVFAVQLVAGRTYCYSTGHYWAALSALDPSGAPIDDGDWVPVPDGPEGTFERRFVAPITGLYGLKVSYRQYDNFAVSTACVISDHGISGDTPAADWPAKLQEGSTTGTIHYPGDRDVFEIPWEAGTAYRLRITGGSDVSVLRAANYTYQPAADEPVFYYYVPFGVPRNSDPITVRGLTVGQHYTLTIERIGRLHPTDGVVEGPLGWPVVRLGERATLFSLAPLQPVRFGVRVEANRWYRFDLSSAFLNQTEAPSYVWGSFFDENGAFLHRWSLGDPFFAHDSGVLWVQPDYAPSWPLYAEQMDLGPGSDEGGPSLEQPATVRLGEIIEATIDRPGDRDTWQTQGLDRGGYALVFVDSNGQELRRSDWRLSGWQITALVDDTIVAPKAVFPFAYRVMIVEQPILPPVTPLPFCIGDFASAGARAGGDRRRDNNDLIFFINAFFANQRSADIASAGAVIGGDGWLDNNDLVVMLDLMFTPCP